MRTVIKERYHLLGVEEVANAITHGLGFVLSLIGFVFLTWLAAKNPTGWQVASCFIYGTSLVALYLASTLYHTAVSEKAKLRLQLIDHCCIYLLIAGSYTPFAMIPLRDGIGPYLFVFAWVFAAVGISMKLFMNVRSGPLSAITYLLMGWVGLVAVQPLYETVGFLPMALIVAGGVSYTLGTIFFGWHSLKHHHAIWHIFVLGGSVLHFIAIAGYIIPYTTNL
ncbi:MAG: hemolysin III family protein [Pyrinomonadaceae bacterium]